MAPVVGVAEEVAVQTEAPEVRRKVEQEAHAELAAEAAAAAIVRLRVPVLSR